MRVVASKRIDTSALRQKLSGVISRALPLADRQDIIAKRLQPVADLMEANAPKFSGDSAKQIEMEVHPGNSPGEAVVALGVGRDGFPLFFNEYGTEDQQARPVIRPAWESMSSEVLAGISDDVAARVRKAAQ